MKHRGRWKEGSRRRGVGKWAKLGKGEDAAVLGREVGK